MLKKEFCLFPQGILQFLLVTYYQIRKTKFMNEKLYFINTYTEMEIYVGKHHILMTV